jgi:hypothetical protein
MRAIVFWRSPSRLERNDMSKRVAVVIAEDPTRTHRPVEALRIALGLCAGDHETTIVLLGTAPRLLTDDTDDVIDVDILEKYRPSLGQLAVPFIVESSASTDAILKEFPVTQKSPGQIRSFLQSCDRTLVFS